MEKLKVKGHLLEVNYEEELEAYLHRLEKAQQRGNKIQACSPFRNENHPSWAVNLDNGSWVDSGADSESERKGSFISLLAFFRGGTFEETSEYLFEKYSHFLDDADGLKLNLDLKLEEPEVAVLGADKYADVVGIPSGYLTGRGITLKTQAYFQTGMGRNGDAVAIPWHDAMGRIINIKYRSIKGKDFWFSKGGQPIKNHVYGLFAIKKHGFKEVWAVESEIDALYLWSMGIPAIAFGGASINEVQKKIILNTGIETLVIATDNDVVGHRFAEVLKKEFGGIFNCLRLEFPEGVKDVNEMSSDQIKSQKKCLKNFVKFCVESCRIK